MHRASPYRFKRLSTWPVVHLISFAAGLGLFSAGFLLSKVELLQHSSYADQSAFEALEKVTSAQAGFTKFILVVVDGLRSEAVRSCPSAHCPGTLDALTRLQEVCWVVLQNFIQAQRLWEVVAPLECSWSAFLIGIAAVRRTMRYRWLGSLQTPPLQQCSASRHL